MKVEKKTVAREVVTTTEEEVFSLELSREEACALQAVLGHISGSANTNNIRNTTNKIYQGLSELGINYFSGEVAKYAKNIRHGMEVGNR